MTGSAYSKNEKLTNDQINYLKSGLVKITAKMTIDQISDIVEVLQDIRSVRHQHRAFRSINKWA